MSRRAGPLALLLPLLAGVCGGCPGQVQSNAPSAQEPNGAVTSARAEGARDPTAAPPRAEESAQAPTQAGPPPPPRIPAPEDGVPQTDLLPTREIEVGGQRLTVWIADTEPSRELGLMHVRSMAEERGMLFVYTRAGRRAFWMRNTLIPLSLAYITSEGRVAQLLDMEPQTLTAHPSDQAVRYVLEVNQGWFARHQVRVGARVSGLQGLEGS